MSEMNFLKKGETLISQDGPQYIIRRPNGTIRVCSYSTKPSRTQQQFQDQSDINNIMKKYKKTGQITHLNSKTGIYGDFSDIGSYQESLDKVLKANESFLQLPSETRNFFANDPQRLIDFLNDPKNDEESIKMGLRVKPPEPEVVKPTEVIITEDRTPRRKTKSSEE